MMNKKGICILDHWWGEDPSLGLSICYHHIGNTLISANIADISLIYHDDIHKVGIAEVIEESGIHSTYRTELNKAVKLAKYVIPK